MTHPGKRKAFSSGSYSYGKFPEDGAIFMSSRATKQECLNRNLFGLPMAFADFVKAVRSGMTLFLFEYESRKLYGVFQAVSDGQLDINPHAYQSSSQKAFPAQVRVRVIWDCHPIPEAVFREAISDNYYQKNKFNFGLSRHQVDRLLQLFTPITRPEKPLLKKKAKKRRTRTSNDLRELTGIPGNAKSHATEQKESGSVQSAQEPVKDFSSFLGDYIPLSPVAHCNVEISVKSVYSITSEQGRGVQRKMTEDDLIPNFIRMKQNPIREADLIPNFIRNKQNPTREADLIPNFIRMKQNPTREADRPMNDEYQDSAERHVSKRASVFSRLTFT